MSNQGSNTFKEMKQCAFSQRAPDSTNLDSLLVFYKRFARDYGKTNMLSRLHTTPEEFYEIGILLQLHKVRRTLEYCTETLHSDRRQTSTHLIDGAYDALTLLPQDRADVQALLASMENVRTAIHYRYAKSLVELFHNPDSEPSSDHYHLFCQSAQISGRPFEEFNVSVKDLSTWEKASSRLHSLKREIKLIKLLSNTQRFCWLRWLTQLFAR